MQNLTSNNPKDDPNTHTALRIIAAGCDLRPVFVWFDGDRDFTSEEIVH